MFNPKNIHKMTLINRNPNAPAFSNFFDDFFAKDMLALIHIQMCIRDRFCNFERNWRKQRQRTCEKRNKYANF